MSKSVKKRKVLHYEICKKAQGIIHPLVAIILRVFKKAAIPLGIAAKFTSFL